jgi:hypothetical protein
LKVMVVPVAERFDGSGVSNVVEDGRALSLYLHYTCPSCAQVVRLSKHDLEVRAKERFSNLQPILAAAIDAWAAGNALGTSPFLDWVCPGCSRGARVYIETWAGGRHGDSGADLKVLAEVTL